MGFFIRKFKHMLASNRVGDYPLYDVPHKKPERDMPMGLAVENFEYFKSVKQQRLEFFQDWIYRKFRVSATLDANGIRQVSNWIDGYGGGIIEPLKDVGFVYYNYTKPWINNYSSLNVVIDASIFYGEYLIAKRPFLYWDIYKGDKEEPSTFRSHVYKRPCLSEMTGVTKAFPLSTIFNLIMTSLESTWWKNIEQPYDYNRLISSARSILYLSTLPPGTIIGTSENEQL